MKKKYLIFWLLSFFLAQVSLSQTIGNVFIQNYSAVTYKAAGQNWGATQDSKGVMYFANTEGVLVFDQSYWKLIRLPNSEAVRDICLGANDRMYVLGDETFGYLTNSEMGVPKYNSLKNALPKEEQTKRVYKIFSSQNKLYVFVGTKIYEYEKGKIQEASWSLKGKGVKKLYNFSELKGQLYFSSLDHSNHHQWFKVENGKIKEVKNLNNAVKAINSRIFIVQGEKSNEIILVSSKKTILFNLETTQFYTLFEGFSQAFLEKGISSVAKLSYGLIAVGTRTSGLSIFNMKGTEISTIKRKSGLNDNEVYDFFIDQQHGVWTLLGNGLSRVDLFSPFSNWYDEVGGWVTDVLAFNDQVYVGSLGLYHKENNSFTAVDGISGNEQVWFVRQFKHNKKNDVIIGTNKNIYTISNGKAVSLLKNHKPSGVYQAYYQSRLNPKRVYLAGYKFVEILEYTNNGFKLIGKLSNNDLGHIRCLQEDNEGIVWMACYSKGIFKTEDFKRSAKGFTQNRTFKVEHFTEENGFPRLYGNRIHYYQNDLIFSTTEGIYTYHKDKKQFIPDPRFEKMFKERGASAQILWQNQSNTKDNELLVSAGKNDSQAISIVFEGSEGSYWYDIPFKRLPIFEIEVITKSDDGVIWIGGSGGLYKYNPVIEREFGAEFKTLLREVTIGEDSLIFNGLDFENLDSTSVQKAAFFTTNNHFEFNLNDIRFKYSAPYFDIGQEGNMYQYMLEGFDDKWSEWMPQTDQRFTNLNPGDYTFRVKSKNTYGTISDEEQYHFSIDYPWFFNIWSILIYIVSISLGIVTVVRWNSKRLEDENKVLESVVEERTTEIQKHTKEIEKAYQNIHTLSVIGQKITSTLEMTELNRIVYEHISGLMDVTSFGVGVINEQIKKLEFRGFIEKQKVCDYEGIDLSKGDNFSINCYKNNEIVLIDDLEEEYPKLFDGKTIKIDATTPQSLIYVPLELKGKVVGILTVQALKKNAFTEKEKSLLESLASYVTIALSNIFSYNVIKEKNTMITDSIHYAENIQAAFLPSKSDIGEVFHNYFLIHRPKDIVSGDFYWFSHQKEKLYVAVVDCTGHGVPGAFMSMVGTSLLNDVVNRSAQVTPADILLQLHKGIVKSFKQYETGNLDGMDISLCCIEPTSDLRLKVTYAGAKLPFYGIRNGEFFEIRGDNKAIGGYQKEKERFYTDHEFTLDGGDTIYLISDGFAGQNNIDRKKFGNRRLKQTLLECMHLPMSEQGRFLEEELESYMKGVEQRDDITVFGVKL